MPLIRISQQNRKTLEEFYAEISQDSHPVSIAIGETMLQVIKKLQEVFREVRVLALTSLFRLVLVSEDDSASKWHVVVNCVSETEIYIDQQMPPGKDPSPDLVVKRRANSIEEAVEYILAAMKESRGWESNEEVMKLID